MDDDEDNNNTFQDAKEQEEEDDDDIAELFSFSAEDSPVAGDGGAVPSSANSSTAATTPDDARERTGSNDSLMEMLASETRLSATTTATTGGGATDRESQEILDWLDGDNNDDKESEVPQQGSVSIESSNKEDAKQEDESDPQAEDPQRNVPAATVVALPPVFSSVHEALHSSESTTLQIRDLYAKTDGELSLSEKDRQELYCRMVVGKCLEDTQASSLADSFEDWKVTEEQQQVQQQANALAKMVAAETKRSTDECQVELTKILLYYFKSSGKTRAPKVSDEGEEPKTDQDANQDGDNSTKAEESTPNQQSDFDPLIAPVAASILSTGMPVAAASVVLVNIIPNYMPLLALQLEERWEAALSLHTELYRLASYHLPFLVYHLDRYLPGWYWPRIPESPKSATKEDSATRVGRNLQKQGQLPPSWLLSHWAGECGEPSELPLGCVLELWDRTLLTKSIDMRFFLALAVLQEASDELLLLTDDALLQKLQSVIRLDVSSTESHVGDWWSRAQFMQSRTPESVISKLRASEDQAVQQALKRRQERTEAALQARLEAEAAAYRLAQEKKADEARERLTRARLIAFYRKNAPDKESNVDTILEKYAGSYNVLDAKLKKKYGEGFNPAVKPKPKQVVPKGPNMLLASMNQGFGRRKEQEESSAEDDDDERKPDEVTVTVLPSEVLPVICWSREASASRGVSRRRQMGRKPLKFYLVDSRSEEAASEQGRFPTAVSLSPETMLDPERIRQNEDLFESLRGAVHIVVMGEGFSALPSLYSQKLSPNLDELTREDESRTNICALFFIKRGFPFVSVLEGGFAAAHSWLVREGPEHHLSVSSALVDYDPSVSLFGQMEMYHNASASEKAQRVMQNLLESSLVSMTRSAQKLERLASEHKEGKQSLRINIFRRGKTEEKQSSVVDNVEDQGTSEQTTDADSKAETQERHVFRNPFARKEGRHPSKDPNATTETTQETSTESNSMLKNPFARLRRLPSGDDAESQPSEGEEQTEATNAAATDDKVESTTEAASLANRFSPFRKGAGKESDMAGQDSTKPSNNSPFKSIGIALNKTMKSSNTKSDNTSSSSEERTENVEPETKPTNNPFKGIGAAFNNSMVASSDTDTSNGSASKPVESKPTPSVPTMLKRNPFARFGASKQEPSQTEKVPSNTGSLVGLAGLNQLRKSTMARMRTTGSAGEHDAETEEESIAFDGQEDVPVPSMPAVPQPEGHTADIKKV